MKNIAIVCGGFSGEYLISVQSANMVKQNLDADKYNTYVIIIEKNSWYFEDDFNKRYLINKEDFSICIKDKVIKFDGVFNAIHGSPGEDGKLLGYFDMINIPYTSCDADTSALTFNKYLCNSYVQSVGINIAKSFSFLDSDNIDISNIISTLGLPLFVKPARSGSSVGISKVGRVDEFDAAVKNAFKTDNRILIEEFIDGREIACGLFMKNKKLVVLPLTEIISENDFFDYEAKYTGGLAKEVTPPRNLSAKDEAKIVDISSLLYSKLGCRGIVRVDFIINKTGIYFIEINTVPGMSPASIIPKQATAMGITVADLFNTSVENMFLL